VLNVLIAHSLIAYLQTKRQLKRDKPSDENNTEQAFWKCRQCQKQDPLLNRICSFSIVVAIIMAYYSLYTVD